MLIFNKNLDNNLNVDLYKLLDINPQINQLKNNLLKDLKSQSININDENEKTYKSNNENNTILNVSINNKSLSLDSYPLKQNNTGLKINPYTDQYSNENLKLVLSNSRNVHHLLNKKIIKNNKQN